MPRGIWIVRGHRLRKLGRVETKILFVDSSGCVDNERHDTRGAVLNGVGDEGKSRAHLSIDDIVFCSALRMWSLASEDPKHISIERNMLADLICREALARVSDKRVDRAIELIARTMPVQTVVLALIADQSLSKLLGEIPRRAREILVLRFDQFAARTYGG